MAKSQLTAKVIVSEKPDDDIVRMIGEFVEKHGCSKVRFVIDPEILGGVVIRIGDKVYDGSLKSRLETIRQSL